MPSAASPSPTKLINNHLASATFKIVEPKTEDDDDDENVPVPDTGAFTSEGGSAKTTDLILPTAAIIGLTIIAWILAKRTEKE